MATVGVTGRLLAVAAVLALCGCAAGGSAPATGTSGSGNVTLDEVLASVPSPYTADSFSPDPTEQIGGTKAEGLWLSNLQPTIGIVLYRDTVQASAGLFDFKEMGGAQCDNIVVNGPWQVTSTILGVLHSKGHCATLKLPDPSAGQPSAPVTRNVTAQYLLSMVHAKKTAAGCQGAPGGDEFGNWDFMRAGTEVNLLNNGAVVGRGTVPQGRIENDPLNDSEGQFCVFDIDFTVVPDLPGGYVIHFDGQEDGTASAMPWYMLEQGGPWEVG